jgi:hypothetical protein
MNNFKKSQDAVSVLQSESEILMYELAPCDWAELSQRVESFKAYLNSLEAEYSEE